MKKTGNRTAIRPSNPAAGHTHRGTRNWKDTCTPVFITALFTIARTWKQPRCPSADKWIRNVWYIYTMEYYSVMKKNAFESVLMRWMKLELELRYDPAIPLLGIHTETRIERNTCTPVFITALFTIARTWKQTRCPMTDEWIIKLWYIYTMEYYSAIKKNTFESVLMRWMKLEAYYTEWSKSERKTPIQHINAYIWNLERW